MLGTLPPNKKSSWRDMVPILVHAYNYTRHTATGFSPYYFMYGQKPRLPVNLYFGTQSADMNAIMSTKFMQQLPERLKWAYKTAQHVTEMENQRHKCNYNHKIKCTPLEVGDKVLLKRTAFKGKHKTQDHWKETVYHVEGQPYAVLSGFQDCTQVTWEGKVKIVHQNLLLPFGGNIEGVPENEGILAKCWWTSGLHLGSLWWWWTRDWGCVATDPKPVHEGGCNLYATVYELKKSQIIGLKLILKMGKISIWAPIM